MHKCYAYKVQSNVQICTYRTTRNIDNCIPSNGRDKIGNQFYGTC